MTDELRLYVQATERSLENAERWIEDARLLIGNSSFGHASALLRFACEELSKAFICWAVSERIYPIESRIIHDALRSHEVKNRLLVGFAISAKFLDKHSSEMASTTDFEEELSMDEFVEAFELLDELTSALEKVRQKSIYVDIDFSKKKVITPLSISERKIMTMLKGTETYLRIVKHYVVSFPEAKKKIFREFASSVPREVWKGEFDTPKAVEWLKEVYGIDLSSS